jgi:hypothetical protein
MLRFDETLHGRAPVMSRDDSAAWRLPFRWQCQGSSGNATIATQKVRKASRRTTGPSDRILRCIKPSLPLGGSDACGLEKQIVTIGLSCHEQANKRFHHYTY